MPAVQHSGGEISDGQSQPEASSSGEGEQRCANCGSTEGRRWYRVPASGKPLCDTCYMYRRRTGVDGSASLIAAHRQAQAEGRHLGRPRHAPPAADGAPPAAGQVQLHGAEEGEPVEGKQQPSRQQFTRGQPTRQQPPRGQPTQPQPSRQQPSRGQPSRQQPSREQPSRQQPSRQQPPRGQPTQQEPTRQQPSRQRPDSKGKEQQQPQKAPEPPASVQGPQPAQARQRRCFQCGSRSPGNYATASWRRHPATGQEWLCCSCGRRADRVFQTQQEQEQRERERAQRQQQQKRQQRESSLEPAAKRQSREQQPTAPSQAVTRQQGMGSGSGGGTGPATVSRAAAATRSAPPAATAAVQQHLQQLQPDTQQDLFSLLLGAAEQAAAAASGLTADLSASFSALLDTLPPDQQAAKVRTGPGRSNDVSCAGPALRLKLSDWQTPAVCACGCMQEARLRLLVGQGLYSAAAQLMATALRLAGA